jgi:predicted RNA-binding protein with PIN domain
MHIDSILKIKKEAYIENAKTRTASIAASDAELMKIFERTYGKIERKNPNTVLNTPKSLQKPYKAKNAEKKFDTEYLLVDGYNIIFAWDDLRELAKESLDAARNSLIDRISAYKVFRGCEVIVVFDAYKVKGNRCEVENVLGVSVVYTKEAQTADSYIEKTARELSRNYKVTVATSDGLEQLIIFGSGAFRLSAKAFMDEVVFVEENVREIIHRNNFNAENTEFLSLIREKLEEAKPGCKE